MFKEALYYEKKEDKRVQCKLCPHNCIINEGKTGICKVRKNTDGILVSLNYEELSAVHPDPVEKKPLYHFYPGTKILSLGSIGCNMSCKFCQNSNISQIYESKPVSVTHYSSDIIIKTAKRLRNNIGIAYTYNEPVVWYEFMLETASKAHKEGLKNVMVTNGFINREPLEELLPFIDAFNIDLKAFTDDFYKKQTNASLNPVLETLKTVAASGKHFEITNLIIPSLNDDIQIFENMLKAITDISGKNTVLHLSRYFPAYKLNILETPEETLLKFHAKAKEYLNYVYLGNIITENGNATRCPDCGEILIARSLRYSKNTGIINNRCKRCKCYIPAVLP